LDLKLNGKVAVISGSSRGIGFSIASALYNEGCKIILNGRHFKSLKKSAMMIDKNVDFVVADVTKKTECKKLIKYAISKFGNIDILVCNVGDGRICNKISEKKSDWQKMLDLNLNSSINLITESLSSLKKTSGSIICISSIAGLDTIGAPISYSVAKSALNSYVKNSAKPFAKIGIRINAIAPGNILFKGSTWEKKLKENENKIFQMISNEVPMKRFGTPNEIAHLTTFIASPLSSFITGNIIEVDGGQLKN
jgi:3-oxoacyl-[acyl-carrier protein] reductase